MSDKRVPVLYLDLDGTVRKGKDELGRFVNKAEDVELFDGMTERLLAYKKSGWRIVGVTNQGGVALGILSFKDMAEAVVRTQELAKGAFDKIMVCQHHPEAKDPEYAVCWCRKPRSGNVVLGAMALREDHPDEMYPPHLALFVGDRPEDEECAKGAGVQFMWAKDWRGMPVASSDSA